MGMQPHHHLTTRRALATWLALAVLFWQMLLSAGAIERPMAPLQVTDGGIAICTEHGMQTLPLGDTAPGHQSDHSTPPCPCCLSFTAASATILADAAPLVVPHWIWTSAARPLTTAALVRDTDSGPQQPRAPPVSI
ncbi:MAG TPA: DUF2946 family protein [Magnetospirillaceae bacterium]|jgi:hypothetical protein